VRNLGIAVVLSIAALAWTAAAQADHVTLPDAAVNACETASDNQIARGVQAGGGPKSIDLGPMNCDMFWFRFDHIGNDLSGGPITCFWATRRGHPELCAPNS
jgi:hypothetical protein